MPSIKDINNEPGYDAEATGASKATIFTFIATFVVSLFYFDNTVGLISGAVFVFVGMFAVSILISAPTFILKKKFPSASVVFSFLDVAVTMIATVLVFSYFFTNPLDFGTPATSDDKNNPYVLRCNEEIPEFTLSGKIVPTQEQVNEVCGCVWAQMSPWAKEVSTAVVKGQEGKISKNRLRAFISHFGQKIKKCNT